jgi:hypothetical protein
MVPVEMRTQPAVQAADMLAWSINRLQCYGDHADQSIGVIDAIAHRSHTKLSRTHKTVSPNRSSGRRIMVGTYDGIHCHNRHSLHSDRAALFSADKLATRKEVALRKCTKRQILLRFYETKSAFRAISTLVHEVDALPREVVESVEPL